MPDAGSGIDSGGPEHDMKRTPRSTGVFLCIATIVGMSCDVARHPVGTLSQLPGLPPPGTAERLVISPTDWPGPERLLVYDHRREIPTHMRETSLVATAYLSGPAFLQFAAGLDEEGLARQRKGPSWVTESQWAKLEPVSRLFIEATQLSDTTPEGASPSVVEISRIRLETVVVSMGITVWRKDGDTILRGEANFRGRHQDPLPVKLRDTFEKAVKNWDAVGATAISSHKGIPWRKSFGEGREEAQERIVKPCRVVFADGSAFDTHLRWYSTSVTPGDGGTLASNSWFIPGIGYVLRQYRAMDVDDRFVEQLPVLMDGGDGGVEVRAKGWDVLKTLIVPSQQIIWTRSGKPDSYFLKD